MLTTKRLFSIFGLLILVLNAVPAFISDPSIPLMTSDVKLVYLLATITYFLFAGIVFVWTLSSVEERSMIPNTFAFVGILIVGITVLITPDTGVSNSLFRDLTAAGYILGIPAILIFDVATSIVKIQNVKDE